MPYVATDEPAGRCAPLRQALLRLEKDGAKVIARVRKERARSSLLASSARLASS